tara:strand:- start:31 stop:546 length:516 start_codon:yes stop_codon:yes gene_type:complete
MVMTAAERKESVRVRDIKYRLENKDKVRASKKKYNLKNKDKIATYGAKWRSENKDRLSLIHTNYAEKNKEKIAANSARWAADNRDKRAFYESVRRAKKFGATIYMTKEDKEKIAELYIIAKDATNLFGYDWEVDHIVPLNRGGLHKLSNLQVVPKSWNCAKGDRNCNTYWD